ncbi:MAG: ABC transporter permease [Roseibacillus sp.]
MRETLTILGDSLKLLRARKLFWIVLVISLLVGFLYASIGFNDEGFSILFGLKTVPNDLVVKGSDFSKIFYLLIFTSFITPHWLGFLAVLLALVTSCSVFPELMKEGSIETVLSKPVSRWKIFAVKYLGMLGFMAVPLSLFCLIVFLAMGLRVGVWKFEIFYAVPLLTFVFSLLYSLAVMIGVWTKSTLFALLATMLFWGVSFLLHISESLIYDVGVMPAKAGLEIDFKTGETIYHDEAQEVDPSLMAFYNGFRKATWVLPKPRKSTLLLGRLLVFDEELGPLAGVSMMDLMSGVSPEGLIKDAQAESQERMSLTEILLPSALFQVVMLGLGGWIFVRRDF